MTGRIVEQIQLSNRQRDAMFRLLATHFQGPTRGQFDLDLGEKNWVVLIEQAEALVGFSTLLVYPATVGEEHLTVICSGDTIVSPSAWGSMAFPRTWLQSIYSLPRGNGDGRLIWLLLTSGFRTYRFLPVFLREFYPRFGRQTPAEWDRMRLELATARFGSLYCPQRGVVRFAQPQRLRPELAEIAPGRALDPDVQFFLERNPGHVQGDELVCIASLDQDNLAPAGRRVVYGTAR